MSTKRYSSETLLLRLGVSLAAITLFALVGMGISAIIAQIIKGSGDAVNVSNSLRMQTYRVINQLLLAETNRTLDGWRALDTSVSGFEQRLDSATLIQTLSKQDGSELAGAYKNIRNRWISDIKPAIAAFKHRHFNHQSFKQRPFKQQQLQKQLQSQAQSPTQDEMLLAELDSYVADIDRLVSLQVDDVESKVMLQRTLLGMTLFLTLVVIFYTMYWARTDLVLPLLQLSDAARRVQQGDLSVRVQYDSDDELGRLGRAFNTMAEDLSKLYRGLEQRIAEKTADLERSNRSLELLYHSIAGLYSGSISSQQYQLLLQDIERTIGVVHGAACLVHGGARKATVLAATFETSNKTLCEFSSCAECLGDGKKRTRLLNNGARIISLPLRDAERQYGVLQLEIHKGRNLESWQTQLLEALCRHIGTAIGTAQRAEQSRRLSLFEERAVIARELHDSLAQSLSYMKIQVSRMEMALKKTSEIETVQPVLVELRTGLNSAYRELRELLTTFRLRIDGEGFIAALQKTVDEYSNRGEIPITYESHITGCHLTPNQEIHLLQIIREALSNVVHHAKASQARVCITAQAQGLVVVSIEDDGIGIKNTKTNIHHYGIAIMNERARGLKGSLTISPRNTGGTRVLLKFNTSDPLEVLSENEDREWARKMAIHRPS